MVKPKARVSDEALMALRPGLTPDLTFEVPADLALGVKFYRFFQELKTVTPKG